MVIAGKINLQLDRALPNTTIRIRKTRLISRIVIGMLVFIAFFSGFRYLIHPSVKSTEILSAAVETGNVKASLTAYGTILPAFEEIITSPIQSQIVTTHFDVGDRVNKGDSILELDKNSTRLNLEKLAEELMLQKNKITQLNLQLEKKMIDLQTSYEIKRLYTESLEERLKEEQYMLDLGGGTKEKLKQARLNLQISRIELRQIEQTMKNDRLTMQADLEELQHRINIQEKNVRELKTRLSEAEIRTKNPGVITWIDNQVGKSVNQGTKLVAIANLEKFKAEGKISDIYLDKLYPGQPVIIEISDKTKLNAKITSVLPAIENNIVRFNIRFDEESHPSLRPNMEVDIHVITSLQENVRRIKNGAFYRGGEEQPVFVLKGDKAVRKSVHFGKSNFEWIEIVEGVDAGEELIISDMSAYEHVNEISIK